MKIRKIEVVIIGVILLVAVGALLYLNVFNQTDHKTLEITVDGEVYKRIELSPDLETEFTISNAYGENHITIINGIVSVDYADCKNQVCVNTKKAQHVHDTIVCLPHKLILEIIEQEK